MKRVLIGQIVNTHGLKGELRIISNFPYKNQVFKKGFKIYVGQREEMCIINTYRPHKIYDMVTFNGINDIDAAIAYKGDFVYIDRCDLHVDGYINDDIIGFNIFDGKKSIGELKEIVNNGAHDILVALTKDEHKIMIPFVDEYVKNVDLDKKRIDIETVEGLIDGN